MKALVHTEPYVFTYMEVSDPEPEAEDVIVKVENVGICGSDVHGYTGESGRRIPPVIMGHEAAGTVHAVGRNVPDAPTTRLGTRVCFDSTVFCNECAACRNGQPNRCVDRYVLGVSIPGMKRQGAMAEYVKLPWWTLVEMPETLPFRHAAMIEPVSIGVHAVNIGEVDPGDDVLIIGAGTIGLFVLQAARLKGAGRIFISDLDAGRLKRAEKLGADVRVNTSEQDVVETVHAQTDGAGVDVAFEVVGVEATLRQAISATRTGGRVGLVGNLTKNVGLDIPEIISKELSLRGSYASSGEYPDCMRLVAEGEIDVETLISETLPLSEGQQAFERLRSGEEDVLKIILKP